MNCCSAHSAAINGNIESQGKVNNRKRWEKSEKRIEGLSDQLDIFFLLLLIFYFRK